jgi:hypothetical protein
MDASGRFYRDEYKMALGQLQGIRISTWNEAIEAAAKEAETALVRGSGIRVAKRIRALKIVGR